MINIGMYSDGNTTPKMIFSDNSLIIAKYFYLETISTLCK